VVSKELALYLPRIQKGVVRELLADKALNIAAHPALNVGNHDMLWNAKDFRSAA
jgi:hypothetical protein